MFFKKSRSNIITLLTDFGQNDPYVGIMKGVILGINPKAKIIDLCHNIPAQDIKKATFFLYQSVDFFSKGTVHIAVIDPGVGTERKNLIIKTNKYHLIVPDNGLAGYLLQKEKNAEVFEISKTEYMLKNISNTFHGRDIFSPIGAHISNGVRPEKIGKKTSEFITLSFPGIFLNNKDMEAEIIHIDVFGNLITNITLDQVRNLKHIKIKNTMINTIEKSYKTGKGKKAVAIIGSSGFLEISCFNSNAAEKLKVKTGEKIQVKLR